MSIIPTSVWWLLAVFLFGWLLAPIVALVILLRVVMDAREQQVSAVAPTPYIAPSIEHPTVAQCRPPMPAGA